MTIDTADIDVTLDEAILKDGECVGYVTSGSFAHHVQQSMALGYVPVELAADGTELEVEINGEIYAARVVGQPLYDPAGGRMRGQVFGLGYRGCFAFDVIPRLGPMRRTGGIQFGVRVPEFLDPAVLGPVGPSRGMTDLLPRDDSFSTG